MLYKKKLLITKRVLATDPDKSYGFRVVCRSVLIWFKFVRSLDSKYCSNKCVLFPCRKRDDYMFDSISSICGERYVCEDAQEYLYK
jgi:hypothetical protein